MAVRVLQIGILQILIPHHQSRILSHLIHKIRDLTGVRGNTHGVAVGREKSSGALLKTGGSGKIEFCEVNLEALLAQGAAGFLQGVLGGVIGAQPDGGANRASTDDPNRDFPAELHGICTAVLSRIL
jgi:hypothetical protein